MCCIGILLALSVDQARQLQSLPDEQALMARIDAVYSAQADGDTLRRQNLDEAWDAIQRCLSDGSLREPAPGDVAAQAIYGGIVLNQSDNYIIRLKPADLVGQISAAIAGIDAAALRRCYDDIPEDDYGIALSEGDFAYTLFHFRRVQDLYAAAAEDGDAVLFSADQ